MVVPFLPFALILGIFYVMILMPMQRRQKKVQEFQGALKVGRQDRYDRRDLRADHRVNDKSVQLQVADKVRIEIARASVGGYQGQEPVVPETNVANLMKKNIRWKLIASLAVFVIFFTVGVYPILAQRYHCRYQAWLAAKQLKLGLDLKGGVHLVLRVQTDEALKIHTTTTSEQLREALKTAGITVTSINVPSAPISFRVQGVPPEKDADFTRARRRSNDDRLRPHSGAGGTYDFTMKPNIAITMRELAVTQARETIDRRVNELGVAEPNISLYGQSNDEILVQLPGVTDVARAKEIIRNTAILELKIVEAGPAQAQGQLLQTYGGKAPDDMEILPGSPVGRHGTVITWCARLPPSPDRIFVTPSRRSTRTTARRWVSRSPMKGRASSAR